MRHDIESWNDYKFRFYLIIFYNLLPINEIAYVAESSGGNFEFILES